jgi:hypothetical protein
MPVVCWDHSGCSCTRFIELLNVQTLAVGLVRELGPNDAMRHSNTIKQSSGSPWLIRKRVMLEPVGRPGPTPAIEGRD